mmetsp:Transcript_58045/g.126907  ORF Transcript_58045/g.126907 Transcript_58045/m.126907 type:complete len:206 (+) Transcript_58045:59-676(+)
MAQPVVVGAPLDHGVNEDLTREERWNIIWAAVNAYYTLDAGIALFIATGAFIASLVVRHLVDSTCESSAWVVSLVVLILRLLDFSCGCISMLRNPVPSRAGFLCDILKNMVITCFQGMCALVQLILGFVLIGQEDCLLNGIIALVSGFVLGVQAIEETFVWMTVWFLWCIAGTSPVPGWTDKWVPERVKVEARKHRQKQAVAGAA